MRRKDLIRGIYQELIVNIKDLGFGYEEVLIKYSNEDVGLPLLETEILNNPSLIEEFTLCLKDGEISGMVTLLLEELTGLFSPCAYIDHQKYLKTLI